MPGHDDIIPKSVEIRIISFPVLDKSVVACLFFVLYLNASIEAASRHTVIGLKLSTACANGGQSLCLKQNRVHFDITGTYYVG